MRDDTPQTGSPPRALIAGWFSWPGCNATAGDTMACDVLSRWLNDAGMPHDIARAEPIEPVLDWQRLDPKDYTHLFFVCGPFRDVQYAQDILGAFKHCRQIGINLSMIEKLADYNPFDMLWERDSDRATRPDMVFQAGLGEVPVVGLMLVHKQREYGDRGGHGDAHKLIKHALADVNAACVPIDTCLENNAGGLTTPEQINAVIHRMDVVVTTRMHGLVMALRNGVPAIAVDAIRSGAKVLAQARSVDWPVVTTVDDLTEAWLRDAIQRCTDPAIQRDVAHSQQRAADQLSQLREDVVCFVKQELEIESVAIDSTES
jgi:hypothetical protein